MRKQAILGVVIASLLGVTGTRAQEPRDFSQLATQTVQLPGTNHTLVFNSPTLQVGEPRDIASLSGAISSWLSANFGLPPITRAPNVIYVSKAENGSYDGRSRTIYLPI